jgi:hypothetical protein
MFRFSQDVAGLRIIETLRLDESADVVLGQHGIRLGGGLVTLRDLAWQYRFAFGPEVRHCVWLMICRNPRLRRSIVEIRR